ncbi:hypothetical protein ERJ75_000377300 [Trypanosoma vivax]|nr:hypothetical protein ERJ75_000377300 [Trypanosoma vivax]
MEDASQQCCATWFRGCGMGHCESATWALSGRSDDSEGWGKAVCRDEAEGGGLLTGVKGDENKDVATAGTCRVFDRFFVRIASERGGQGHLWRRSGRGVRRDYNTAEGGAGNGAHRLVGGRGGEAVERGTRACSETARAGEGTRRRARTGRNGGAGARRGPSVAAAAQKAEKALNALLRVADKMEERVTEVTATQVTKFAQGFANAKRAADILEVFVTALGLTTRIQRYGTAQGQQKCINTGNTAAKLKCAGPEQARSGLKAAVDAVGKLAFNVGVGQSGAESCTAASGNIEADSSSGATSGTKCGCPILFWASKGPGTGTEWTTELANVNAAKTTLDEKDRYWERARQPWTPQCHS